MKLRRAIRSIAAAAAVAFLTLSPSPARAGQKRPTSPETKQRMIQLIATLETAPYVDDAKDYRREVLEWLADAPDVSVVLCAEMLGDVEQLKGDDGAILVGQLAFSQARFILEHPAQANDKHAVNVAGVDGVLRTYVAMQQAKPGLKYDALDKLIQLEADEKLDAYVDQALKKCK